MYIRFITRFINEYNETETGIFQALKFIRDHSTTRDEDVRILKDLKDWFDANLEAPDKFSNASNKNPAAISLSWFKDSSKEHIKKIYEIGDILYKYSIVIEVITTRSPGYIVYEDNYQVSAVPFKTDRKKVT